MIAYMQDKLVATLKKHGYSMTQPRQVVFNALLSGTPRSMRELILDLSSVIDRASIYRTVALFEELGVVVRVNQGWKYKIELSDIFSPHHHHINCTNCGRSVSFDEPDELDQLLTQIAMKHGFRIDDHTLELSGICASCRQARATS